MPEQHRADATFEENAFAARPGRRLRMVREPAVTGGEAAAYALILIMVCGPLAFGAFGL